MLLSTVIVSYFLVFVKSDRPMSAFAKIQYFPSLPLRFLSFLKSTRRQPHTLMLEVDKRMTKHEIKGEFYEAIWGPSGAFCLLTSESLLAGPVCCDAVLPRTGSRHLIVTAQTPICLTQIPVPSLPSLSFLPSVLRVSHESLRFAPAPQS